MPDSVDNLDSAMFNGWLQHMTDALHCTTKAQIYDGAGSNVGVLTCQTTF